MARRRLVDGSPAAVAGPVYACKRCHDMGWVRVFVGPEEWKTELRRCPCQHEADDRRAWERARSVSDLSDEQATLTFEDYNARHNPAALAAAQGWSDGAATPWLVLWGAMDTGKTHLLSAAFNVLLRGGKHPVYSVVPLLLDHVRAGIAEGEYGERFEAVMRSPVLVLDDLGAEKRTEWADEALFKLLDWRYRHRLPTAIASNFHPDELEGRIGSRLQDTRLCTVVELVGPDQRKYGSSDGGATR